MKRNDFLRRGLGGGNRSAVPRQLFTGLVVAWDRLMERPDVPRV